MFSNISFRQLRPCWVKASPIYTSRLHSQTLLGSTSLCFLTSSVIFGISSAYHTLLCHYAHFTDLWGRFDYVAIVFQILGSFITGTYIDFYCEPQLQKIYWTMVCTFGLLTGFVVIYSSLQIQKWSLVRLPTFVATGLSVFAPIIHAASIFPYDQLNQQAGLWYYYHERLSIIIGAVFFAVCLPGGRLDITRRALQVPIDMDAPILEILEIVKGDHMPADNPESFADDVEYYAPGYLAMEAEGRAAEFDPEVLLNAIKEDV